MSPNPAQSFLQGLTVKWCQCWILHCALLRNVCPDFFSNKAWWLSEGLMDWTQQHTNGAAQTWEWSWCLLASLDRMILVWPAEDHGKISRVPIHKNKIRLSFQRGGGVSFFFRLFFFFFVREDLIMSTAEFLDEVNSPCYKFCLISLSQTVYTPLTCSLTATSMFPCSSIRDK